MAPLAQVLYIPRAYFHHTATAAAVLSAEDDAGDAGGDAGSDSSGDASLEGQPSMALTVSILNEDVHSTWLSLVGESVQAAPALSRGGAAHQADADRVVRVAAPSWQATQPIDGVPGDSPRRVW